MGTDAEVSGAAPAEYPLDLGDLTKAVLKGWDQHFTGPANTAVDHQQAQLAVRAILAHLNALHAEEQLDLLASWGWVIDQHEADWLAIRTAGEVR